MLSTPSAPLRVLLLGDSTVGGSVPHSAALQADQLEDVVRKILSGYPDLPPVVVFNKGQDTDTIVRMLATRYEKDVVNLPGGPADYVFIRYGINDRYYQQDWPATYEPTYHQLIAQLRRDMPDALITLETIIPYRDPTSTAQVNDLVRKIAMAEGLPVLDMHAAFDQAMRHNEPEVLTYHVIPLENVPPHLRPLIPPDAIRNDRVYAMDPTLRVHLRSLPGYSRDPHPGLAGYHVIGAALAEYLAPLIRSRR